MKSKTVLVILAVLLILVPAALFVYFRLKASLYAHIGIIGGADGPTAIYISDKDDPEGCSYSSVSMSEAKTVFEAGGDFLILDVRRADEFAKGHIPGAVNVANEEIGCEPPALLPDLEQTIYVYCRSGRRSKQAAAKLAMMGYTHIIDCGGILDWTGEVVK